jgi:hypothetical protein
VVAEEVLVGMAAVATVIIKPVKEVAAGPVENSFLSL